MSFWSGRLALQGRSDQSQSFSAGFELKGNAEPASWRCTTRWAARWPCWPGHRVGHLALERPDPQFRLAGCTGPARDRHGDSRGRAVRLAARHQHARARLAGRPVATRHRATGSAALRARTRGRPADGAGTIGTPGESRHEGAVRRSGPGQAQSFSAHHRAAGRRLPPAAIGLHARSTGATRCTSNCAPTGRSAAKTWAPPLPADDLTVRAARALQALAAAPLGRAHRREKRIPAQAGMGGGSSDAASCLLALNRLWDLHLPLSKLEHIGLQLGADVPFFLRGHNAWVEGIGEKITPLVGEFRLPAARFAVVKPHAGLETRLIFAAADLKRDTETAIISGFAAGPLWLWPKRLAAGCPKALPRCGASARMACGRRGCRAG